MNTRFNRLLLAGIVGAAAALYVTQAAQAGPQSPTVPRPVMLQLNHPAPAGVIPRTARAVPLRVPDAGVYAAQMAAANAAAARRAGRPAWPAPAVLAPAVVRNRAGQRDTTPEPEPQLRPPARSTHWPTHTTSAGIWKDNHHD